MGHPQFMPSSYLKYAEDFDGDGRTDIWQSTPDALASIANYLGKWGWDDDTRGERHGSRPPFASALTKRNTRAPKAASRCAT